MIVGMSGQRLTRAAAITILLSLVRSFGPRPSSQLINQKRSKHLRLPNTLVTPVDFRVRPLFEGEQDLPNLTGLYLVSLAYVFLETGEDNLP